MSSTRQFRVRRPVELLDRNWPMFEIPWIYRNPLPEEWSPSPHDVDDPRWRIAGALLLLLALGYVKPCSWR